MVSYGPCHQDIYGKYFVREECGNERRAEIHRVVCKEDNKNYVLKKMKDAEAKKELKKVLVHPNIIYIKESLTRDHILYNVMEHMDGGNLYSRLKMVPCLTDKVAKSYFYQIALAMNYLHENRIVHKNLKHQNVLLSSKSEDCVVKITDVGVSRDHSGRSLVKLMFTGFFEAPEVQVGGSKKYSSASDVWSMGVMLYKCLRGSLPKVLRGRCIRRSVLEDGRLTKNQRDIVGRMVYRAAAQRIDCARILKHAWFKDDSMQGFAPNVAGRLNWQPEVKHTAFQLPQEMVCLCLVERQH